jgi:hypothetical protein
MFQVFRKKGKIKDNIKKVPINKERNPTTGNITTLGTIHTHPTLERDPTSGIILHQFMHASSEDNAYFREHTPNIPFYVITADGVVHGNILRVPTGNDPINFGGKNRYIEDIIFGGYSLKNRKK